MVNLKIKQIKANKWNCNFLGEQEKAVLKQRMKQDGPDKTQPVMVRRVDSGMYELIDGEQRWSIACELGWEYINAIEVETDDLQSKVLCVGYNRWRGRLNWFKLYDVLKKDVDAGINVYSAYSQALTKKEIEHILSLGKFSSENRAILEQSIKQFPETTLEQIYMITLFPQNQHSELIQKFKGPVIMHALTQAFDLYKVKEYANSAVGRHNEFGVFDRSSWRGEREAGFGGGGIKLNSGQSFAQSSDFFAEKDYLHDKEKTLSHTSKMLKRAGMQKQDILQNGDDELEFVDEKEKSGKALLVEASYDCKCGCHYRISFENRLIFVHKVDELYEKVDVKPRVFQVHCDKCNSNQQYFADKDDRGVVEVFCRRCKPSRKGLLNVDTKGIVWTD